MSTDKKLLYITYYWPPSGGAGVQRSIKFVNYLKKYGWNVQVLTVDPNAATYPVIDESLQNEVSQQVKVKRTSSREPLRVLSVLGGKKAVPYGGFTNSNKEKWYQKLLRFVRGNFFVPDARIGWVDFAFRASAKIIRENNISKIVISSPPHSSQLIGLKLKKEFPHLIWLADLRDPWTDIYYYKDLMHLPFIKKKDLHLERQVLENCDAALVVSTPIADLLRVKSDKIDPNKFTVIPNGFDRQDFPEDISPPKDVFRITYVGTMADSYKPEVFLIALSQLIKSNPEINIQLRLVGSVAAGLRATIDQHSLSGRVEMIGHVSHHKAVNYMCDSSLLLLLIPATANSEGILTGKIFEYLGAGVPILGIGPVAGSAAAVLQECNAGKMFERDNPKVVSEFLEKQLLQWKNNPDLRHHADVSKYERSAQALQLSAILEKLK